MSLEKILSIAGKPGLFHLKAQTRGGFLAESMIDGKKISVSTRHNVSLLSEIAIYTLKKEVPLRDVFKAISEKESGKETISHKSTKDQLEEYFFEILPDYDEDRVYASDIKKIIQWYNILQKNGITDFSEPENENEKTSKPKAKQGDAVNSKVNAAKTTSQKPISAKKGAATKNNASIKK